MQEKYFNGDDVIDDVTGWPQSRFSIFFYEWKTNIFRDNCRTNKDIIFKLSVHMYHWIVNLPLQTIVDCFGDDVIWSPNKSKLWTVIALSIFELEHGSKVQNVTNTDGYLCSIFKFRCHFRLNFIATSRWRPFWKRQNIKHSFNLTSEMKRASQMMHGKAFHADKFIDDVTGWPQSRLSIFHYKWKMTFFVITEERTKISFSSVHTYHRIVNNPSKTTMDC